ncbi:MAG: DUF3417 domain-containing protein, partial [Solirubrobacteraceae bacterium]
NQGHAALAVLELTRRETARGASVDAALEVARRRTVFTTHTPVGAGNETFPRQQLLGAIGGLVAELGVDPDSSCGSGATAPTTTASHSGSHSSACG